MEDAILKEVFYPHKIDKVWKAISDKNQISEWFVKADFEAKIGYHYKFYHEGTIIRGVVLVANPLFELVYTWRVNDIDMETIVKWQLSEQGNGTLLKLEHSGISNYETENAIKMFSQFTSGWENCITELMKYLSTSEVEKS